MVEVLAAVPVVVVVVVVAVVVAVAAVVIPASLVIRVSPRTSPVALALVALAPLAVCTR